MVKKLETYFTSIPYVDFFFPEGSVDQLIHYILKGWDFISED